MEVKAVLFRMIWVTRFTVATHWLFEDGRALSLEDISEFLRTRASVDQNGRCYDFLCEYVVQNRHRFCGESEQNEVWGAVDRGRAYIVRSVFNRICQDEGYSPRAFLSWAKSAGKIEVGSKGFDMTKRINRAPCHCCLLYTSRCV